MSKLRVSTVQIPLVWEDADANIAQLDEHLQQLQGKTDLIILPEMFTTGFSMHPVNIAEPMNGKTMTWMQATANALNAVITGSVIIEDKGGYYNRLLWVRPDGSYETYDKKHLFTLAGENKNYKSGDQKLIVALNDWKVCPLICYDLRFPVWARNVEAYDLLIYTANWPSMRREAWKTLLAARAIENQCYVVGVNRIGTDFNDYPYSGDTSVIDYGGQVLYRCADVVAINTLEISRANMLAFREKLNFLADQDKFEIIK